MRYAMVPRDGDLEVSEIAFELHEDELGLLFPAGKTLSKYEALGELKRAGEKGLLDGSTVMLPSGTAFEALGEYGRLSHFGKEEYARMREAMEAAEFRLNRDTRYERWGEWLAFLNACGRSGVAFHKSPFDLE